MFLFQLQVPAPSVSSQSRPTAENALPEVGRGEVEIMRIAKNLEGTKSYWNSLNPEILNVFRENTDSLNIPGYDKKIIKAEAHGNDVYALKFSVAPQKGTKEFTRASAKELLDTVIEPQLNKIEQLFKENWISSKVVYGSINDSKELEIFIVCNAGSKAKLQANSQVFMEDVLSPAGRKQAWERIFKNIGLSEAFPPATESLQDGTLHHLQLLKTYYQVGGDKVMTSFTQGLIAGVNLKKLDELREYVDLGRVTKEQIKLAPEILATKIDKVNEYTKFMPTQEELLQRQDRVKDIPLTGTVEAVLKLEYQAQVFSGNIVSVAEIEIREAKRYALEKGGKNVDPNKAGEIVRSFFEEHTKSFYDFLDNPQGLAGGIAIRRTDCSTRAIIAYEMFKAMNVKSGTEFMIAQENGRDRDGVQAHLVNWIELPDGKKRYFDFGNASDQPYAFDSDKPIIEHYLNGSERTARTEIRSGDPNIYGAIIREPILPELIGFFSKFSKGTGDLSDFLKTNPEEIEGVKKITNYLRIQDRLFNSKDLEPWASGKRQQLLDAYKGFLN